MDTDFMARTVVPAAKSTGQVKKRRFGSSQQLTRNYSLDLDLGQLQLQLQLQPNNPKRWLGHLGTLAPVYASKTWNWVFEQIRQCPRAFAEGAETIFIHKSLYTDNHLPSPLRAALGICTGTLSSTTQANRQLLFRVLDAELVGLLKSSLTLSLRQELYKFQALVLYQIMRLFYGQVQERILAERQEYLVRSYALKLLQLSNTELPDAPRTWDTWVLAESIRRTVYIAFKMYTSYAMSRYGACTEIQAMSMLPISTNSTLWYSRDSYEFQHPVQDDVMTYKDFAEFYGRTPRLVSEPFEKLIIVGCSKRIEQVDGIVCPRSRVEEII
jgi:hypothetical protein